MSDKLNGSSDTEIIIIQNEKEKVIKALSQWICNELKNTSSICTESILPDVINAFQKLVK